LKRKRPNADYRDFLFLESDSDLAFASEAELLRESDYSTDEEAGNGSDVVASSSLQGNPFTMSWEETGSSGGEDSLDLDDNCGGGSLMGAWRREQKTAVVEPSRKSKRRPSSKRSRATGISPGRDARSDFSWETTMPDEEDNRLC
jgi:hypothetical protein